ncbi:MAG: PolyA polymerase [Candidatus Yanofskybacteria bacterium GW2011_GWD2_39_48]|uniref:PolyA polymerase n=1 Tax=Candidatus Yanofskybacteria bacterium GW2011_GWD2_39_48 TaxID=1619031 RepID=A0A0G0SE37_9BACT|nr:MAG: PolyA polymerase [Candidatus Yanofskybacteria bacterium GW2011_GWD2_39_48]
MKLPVEITTLIRSLNDEDFEAYAVGGCVRDLILGKKPKDWDITTNAKPEQIQKIFPENFYENTFGTVTVKTESEDETLKQIQITPYRIEGKYTDKRHPGEIEFVTNLIDDLSRRDFTINSLAIDKDGTIKDLYNGQKDIRDKIIRTVGKPEDRFGEDALRILRAVRFATILGFKIDTETATAIRNNAGWLTAISKERIRDEFIKIINSDNAYAGVLLLEELGLLVHIAPELREGINVGQNLHHIYTVWEHNLLALKYCADKRYSTEVRLAALFHDIGKPQTKNGDGHYSTFYGHDIVGAKITAKLMERLKFPKETIEKVTRLVRYHLFYYNVGEVTESSVRRLLVNIGLENVEDLIKVREADRIGSGVPKAMPYKLRHLKYIIDKVSHDPISAKMLKINGNDLMDELGIAPGPKVGLILSTLLAEVLDKPENNQKEFLINRIKELDEKSPEELRESLKKIEKAIELEEQERMKKYYV